MASAGATGCLRRPCWFSAVEASLRRDAGWPLARLIPGVTAPIRHTDLHRRTSMLYTRLYKEKEHLMAVTSIYINPDELLTAKELTGSASNRETVDLALRTLIAVRRQPAAVERIIGRRFADDQIDAPTIRPRAD